MIRIRDLVAVAVLVAMFVCALMTAPGPTPTERERWLRERWEKCETERKAEKAARAAEEVGP